MALSGLVYDVTDGGREFYGKEGPYHALTGIDATRLLAKGLLVPESVEDAAVPLRNFELEQLKDWNIHYNTKYRRIGSFIDESAEAVT